MKIRYCNQLVVVGCLLLLITTAGGAGVKPVLSIAPFGYQLVDIKLLEKKPRLVFKIVARAGIVNRGDRAKNVSAILGSNTPDVVILDGQVSFGNVPTSPWRPIISRDTFSLRVVLPANVNPRNLPQIVQFLVSRLAKLNWRISCDNCNQNRPPVSNAGSDQTVFTQSLVTLDGSGSSDADGNALIYRWSFISRPVNSIAVLLDSAAVRPTFTVDKFGDYVVRLIVNDGLQDGAADTVTITTENSAPVASAGDDQSATVGEVVQLDGTASSDIDGNALTYAWSLITRPDGSQATLANPGSSVSQLTPDMAGQYVAELVVDDGSVSSTPDTVAITTGPANSTPIADAGADQTVTLGVTAALDGRGSSDPDPGDVLTYAWSMLARPANSAATLSGANTSQPTFPVDQRGDYVAQLIVDDGEATSSDTVLVTTQNSPPTADAGQDQTVHAGAVVHLDGSNSGDPDNDPLGFTWSLLSQPADSAALLSDPYSITPSFMADLAGLYTAELIVNDGHTDSEPSTVNVTAANESPTAGNDTASTTDNLAVDINVLANDNDPDNDTLSIQSVTVPAHGTTVIQGNVVRYAPNTDFIGEDQFSYTISDGRGATATADVTITVTLASNTGPTAILGVSPNPADVGTNVALSGVDSTDVAPGIVTSYSFTLTSAPAGYVPSDGLAVGTPVAQSTPTRLFTPNVAGSYLLQLVVRDNAGNDSAPDVETLTVISSDLAIGKTVSNAAPIIGTDITFTISLNNSGSTNATGISVADQLPDGYAYVSSSATTGSYSNATGTWTVGAVAAGDDATLSIIATVLATGAYDNTASLAASTPADIDSANNSASVVVTPVPAVDPNVTVPNVTGQTQAAATAALTAANLTTGVVTNENSDSVAAGAVIRQSPAAGASVARGTAVDLVVSLGPAIPGLPPDPSTVAPPTSPTESTTVAGSTAFLYSGPNPIQTGVAPDTIAPTRAAVVRGRVLGAAGQPLPGVTITINNHPEFGQTLSRADGMFDMAVNGGGLLSVNYLRDAYLPGQRQVNVPWQDFVVVDDVVLIQPDDRVTTIQVGATDTQVAQGTPVTDARGARQATVLFPPGTLATMTMPDGSAQPLASLNVRATEYTVGPDGPARMPGPLPPTSGYTYAVDLTVDEALAAGAQDVNFNQPVPFYVENFLNFPVGIQVPSAYYDGARSAWVPIPDGRVIRILSVTAGLADVDSTGDGLADNGAAIGMTETERRTLAQTYTAGMTLWRVQIAHFTSYDHNYGVLGPDDAVKPPERPTDPEGPKDPERPCGPSKGSVTGSSVIDCQQQRLRETIDVAGTPFSLHYASDRAQGYVAGRTVRIQLSGASVPVSLKSIRLAIVVAGRSLLQTFSAAPNQAYTFTWDGRNAFGQQVTGSASAGIRVEYVYDGFYALPPDLSSSFGAPSGVRIPGADRAPDVILSQTRLINLLGGAAANASEGWSLTVHHAYSPASGEIFQGDGQRRAGQSASSVITTVAGNGEFGFSGDGGPATAARFGGFVEGVAVGADGSLFIGDGNNSRIRRVGPDGIITTVAGNGSRDFSGDGGPAITAGVVPSDLAIGADGSLFINDASNRVRRIGPDGIINTVAGNGDFDFSGDGGPATAAGIPGLNDLAIGADGSLFISDYETHSVRRVGPDGIIMTVAGTGETDFSGDGGPATAANLHSPYGLAVGADGSLFIAELDGHRIRRVGPDGIITTIAGNGDFDFSGDGGPATAAGLPYPRSIALGADGSMFVAQDDSSNHNNRVRRVGPDGIITTVAGNGVEGFSGDRGPATAASLDGTGGIAVGADGSLFIGTNNRIRRVVSLFPGFSANDIAITSEDGREIYQFNAAGRHLRTLNALTGSALYSFSYDAAGRLAGITDGDGNQTRVDRNAAGDPLAIVAPDDQRTALTVNGAGYIASVTNPAGEVFESSYDTGGLLTSFMKPRGQVSQYSFDAAGRLISATSADLYGQTLVRTDETTGYQVNRTTALGRTTTYSAEDLAIGGTRRTTTFPDGTRTIVQTGTDGRITTTLPDGSSTNLLTGPDPRFAMQAPVSQTLETTNGSLVSTLQTARVTELANSDEPLSLISLTETSTLNGRQSSSVYTAATRTWLGTSAAGRVGTTVTDDQGRPTLLAIPGLANVATSYDTRGRLNTVTQDTRVTSFTYDTSGYLASITDPLNRTVQFTNDPNGRVTRQVAPNGQQVLFAYDANGNLTSLTPPGRPAHTFEYTTGDLESVYRAPDLGDGLNVTSTAYDLDRVSDLVTLPGGGSIDPVYDAAGRLASVDLSRGQYAYAYNATTGKLQTITAPDGGTLSFAYSGSLLLSEAWGGTTVGSVSQTYDNDFRIATQSVNGANTVAFAYDADSLLTRAGAMALTPDAQNGLLRATSLGTVTDVYAYSTFGELSTYRAAAGATELFNVTYQRDALGRITAKTEVVQGTSTRYAYTYDAIGQLDQVRRDGSLTADYDYDANGNRTSLITTAGTTTGTYDAQDRLLTYGTAIYTYTPDGRLRTKVQSGQTTTYTYDELGNLITVALPNGTTIGYIIDALNRRVGRSVNGSIAQRWVYEGKLRPVAELDAAGSIVSRFIYGSRVNVPEYMVRGGVTYRIIADQLGSPRLIVNTASGQAAQRLNYDEFGNVTEDTSLGFQPFGFAGGIYDSATSLTRFGARDYETTAGRWVSRDPIGFSGLDQNLYRYVRNDPINAADPTGKIIPGVAICLSNPFAAAGCGIATGVTLVCLLNERCSNTIRDLVLNEYFPLPAGIDTLFELIKDGPPEGLIPAVRGLIKQGQGGSGYLNAPSLVCQLDPSDPACDEKKSCR